MRETIKVLGVAAGNGVCLYPFKKHPETFKIVGNWEMRGVFYDKHQHQWEANFPGVLQFRHFKKKLEKIDLIIGHPDCGDSSILRMSRSKKVGNVKDNQSITGFINSITHYKPRIGFLMENLPGLLNTYSEEWFKDFFNDYHIIIHNASVGHWGNSQVSRKRLVIIGINKAYDKRALKYFKLPEYDESQLKFSEEFECGDKEDPTICHVREDIDKTCNLYWGMHRQITYQRAKELWQSEFLGQSRWAVGGKMKNQPGVSRNLLHHHPFTVRKQNRQFGTTGMVLSPREMSNIQGIPKSFKLIFNEGNRNYWINKGRLTVTKTMPYDIAKWFRLRIYKMVNNTAINHL